MSAILPEHVAAAVKRMLDDTPSPGDGRLFRLYLRTVLFSVSPVGESDGALKDREGRRRFASEILTLAEARHDGPNAAIDAADDAALRRGYAERARDRTDRGARRRVGPVSP